MKRPLVETINNFSCSEEKGIKGLFYDNAEKYVQELAEYIWYLEKDTTCHWWSELVGVGDGEVWYPTCADKKRANPFYGNDVKKFRYCPACRKIIVR